MPSYGNRLQKYQKKEPPTDLSWCVRTLGTQYTEHTFLLKKNFPFFAKVEVDFHDWHFAGGGGLKTVFFLLRILASIYIPRLKTQGVKTTTNIRVDFSISILEEIPESLPLQLINLLFFATSTINYFLSFWWHEK